MLQQICFKCGWRSRFYPDKTIFGGPGGQLPCPECTRLKVNQNLEVYGWVKLLRIDDKTGKYFINCSRCMDFYALGSYCKSEFCETVELQYRLDHDLKNLPSWLVWRAVVP